MVVTDTFKAIDFRHLNMRKVFLQIVIIAVMTCLLWVCLLPTQERLCAGDVTITFASMVLSAIGIVLLMACRKRIFHLSLADMLVGLWAVYYLVMALAGEGYSCASQILKFYSLLLFYVSMRGITACRTVKPMHLILFITLFGVMEACLGLCQVIHDSSRHYLYILTGTFQNPGPYSAILMMSAVVGLTTIYLRHKIVCNDKKVGVVIRRIMLLTVVLTLSILASTMSRAALLALAIVLLWVYRRQYWRWRYYVWGMLIAVAVALYLLKQGSADGRLLTWTAAITKWLQTPWLGVGIGGFRHACAEGIAELYAQNPESGLLAIGNVAEYAFCDLLKVLVEQGVVGALLCLSIVGFTIYNLYRWCEPLFYGAVALLLFSLFSYPFELHPYVIIMVMLGALCPHQKHCSIDMGRWTVTMLLAISIFCSYMVWHEMQYRYKEGRAARSFSGMQHTGFIDDYYELLPAQNDNVSFLFDFGKTLREAGRYNDSNDMLRRGARISNDPIFHVVIGNNYTDMKCYDKAAAAYRKAHVMMPNRIYPTYKLMQLYCQQGDTLKTCKMAEQIVNSVPKVESTATDDMVREAKNLIKQNK